MPRPNTTIEELIARLRKADEGSAEAGITLGKIGTVVAIKQLIGALADDHEDICYTAHNILSDFGESAVIPLIEALNSPNPNVRFWVARSLGIIDDKRAVQPLIMALKRDTDDQVRQPVAEALGKLGDIHAVEPLIEALEDHSAFVRGDAARALGLLEDSRAIEPLANLLAAPDFSTRFNAAWSLSRWRDTRATTELIKALDSKNEFIRRAAAYALGNVGDVGALPALEWMQQNDKGGRLLGEKVADAAKDAIEHIQARAARRDTVEA